MLLVDARISVDFTDINAFTIDLASYFRYFDKNAAYNFRTPGQILTQLYIVIIS